MTVSGRINKIYTKMLTEPEKYFREKIAGTVFIV